MWRPGRRARLAATGVGVAAVAAGVALAARSLPPAIAWALLVVAAPYLLGGCLLVALPLVAWLDGVVGDRRVSRG